MKSIVLAIAFAAFFMVGTAQTPVSIQVDGMGCGFCVNSVKKKFTGVEEVSNLQVFLEEGYVTFDVKEGIAFNAEKYTGLIEKAGYEPREIKTGAEAKHFTQGTPSELETNAELKSATTSFAVKGNCGMCKTRIETAANAVKGVRSADWNSSTQMLTISYDGTKTNIMSVHQKLADVGHDTDKLKTDQKTYDNLHGCCKYDRD